MVEEWFQKGFIDEVKNLRRYGSGGGATEPYIEYELDDSMNIIRIALHGFTTIPAYMFKDTTTLAAVDLSNSPNLTNIGEGAFSGCTNLTLISLPDGITNISKYAFHNCTNLALTSLPSSLTTIGDVAFSGCTNLDLASLPSGVTSIGQYAFQSCKKLALTSLSDGLINIESHAFRGCDNLALTSLPDGLTSIKYATFYNCGNLAITSLPSSLTKVGYVAFFCCTSLTNIEIAAQTLGDDEGCIVFKGCTGLQKVWLRSTCTSISTPTVSSAPFMNCSESLEIYAEPAEKPDGWGDYFNRTGADGGTTVTVVYGQTTCPW